MHLLFCSADLLYDIRCNVTELQKTLYHSGIFQKKIWKNARSVSDLVCDFCDLVLYRISRKTGGHPGSGGWNSEYKICGYLLVFPGFVFRISVYPDPVLIPEKYRKRIFGYAILVYFVLEALAPLVCNLMHIEFNEGFEMPAVGGYLIYTLLGYWIDNYELSKKWRCVIYAAALGGFLLMLVGTQILSLKNGTVDTTFKEYRNVPCILYSTGIFLFFKNIKNEKALGCLAKLTAPFSSLTFGIYLVHFYLVQMVAIYQIFPITSIKYRIFGTIAIFLISAVAVRILQMIPVIRKAIPS